MEKQPYRAVAAPYSSLSLQELISVFVHNSQPAAEHNHTQVVNKVEQGIGIGSVLQSTRNLIRDLLTTVVTNSRNGQIYITARRCKTVLVLEIQERNNYNGYALAYSIGSLEPDAALAGGHISMKDPQQKITTISFSFPGNLQAA